MCTDLERVPLSRGSCADAPEWARTKCLVFDCICASLTLNVCVSLSHPFPLLTSLGLWDPVCDTDLSVFPGRGHRGAIYEKDFLQTAAALFHSPGHWHPLLQRPVSAHSRGSILHSPLKRGLLCVINEKRLNINVDYTLCVFYS